MTKVEDLTIEPTDEATKQSQDTVNGVQMQNDEPKKKLVEDEIQLDEAKLQRSSL